MSRLAELRKKINETDKKIISLLNDRAAVAKHIGKIKKEAGVSIYAPEREVEIYENIIKENKGPLPNKALFSIYREVMSGSLGLEKKLKIAYLGPEATFTHQAGIKKFGSNVEFYACPTITDVFRDVEAGRSDYGVVPVENSTEGMISHTLDMFVNSDLKICSEVMLEISHNLLGKGNIKAVKKIYSKQEVFGQCRLWLEINMRGIALIEVSSTSKAAEMASQEKNSAAIASALAGKKYRLNTLAKDIEDNPNNVTRFLVIGGSMPRPTKKDKTSIMFSVKDKVGALHDILVPFKKCRINLTKIESRPSKRKSWEYYFFVDMAGHSENQNVKNALTELEKHCSFLKILGSYPVGI